MKNMAFRPACVGFVLLFVATHYSIAQQFVVIQSNNSKYDNGFRIKARDTLQADTRMNIENGGIVSVRHPNWFVTRFTKPGSYQMDFYLDKIVENPNYLKHDSLYNFLRGYGMDDCILGAKVSNSLKLSASKEKRTDSRLTMKGQSSISTDKSVHKLEWSMAGKYTGNYFVVVSNMFDDYLDEIMVIKKRKIALDLNKYPKESALVIKIYSQDCSQANLVIKRVEHANPKVIKASN
jgi:hypothetical protein